MKSGENLLNKNAEGVVGNQGNIREEYSKIEQMAHTTNDFVDLAGLIARNLQDTMWIKRLYEQAADKVKSVSDLRKIARSISTDLEDREFEEALYLRVLEKTRTKEEYIMYAQLMAIFLKDSDFSRKLCQHIEAIFLPKRTLEEKYKNFINAINGLTAQQKMEKFAEFLKIYKMNKHIKDIYFKAAKEFAQINKREALIAYLKYYQLSFKEDSKAEPVPDRVKKSIFKNEMEYAAFTEVIEALRRDNDISAALAKINNRYRKKIDLNQARIASIKTQHAGTVDKLGKLLEDNEEKKEKIEENPEIKDIKDSASIDWNPIQMEFLTLLARNNYALSRQEAAVFARKFNLFESQLIDGINKLFLGAFDDILIEEEEKGYTINPEYREKIPGLCYNRD